MATRLSKLVWEAGLFLLIVIVLILFGIDHHLIWDAFVR
jgi:hypothetical protein